MMGPQPSLFLGPIQVKAQAKQTEWIQVSLRPSLDSASLGRFHILLLGLWYAIQHIGTIEITRRDV